MSKLGGKLGCVAIPWLFEFYILKCKNFLIDFLDEFGNFKPKIFFFTFYSNGPLHNWIL